MTRPDLAGGPQPAVDPYAESDDPFGVGTSWYEIRKRHIVLACLGRERYARIWDAACGTGHLAADLAPRCDALVATDASARAVELTRALLGEPSGSGQGDGTGEGPREVHVARSALPEVPEQARGCDLVVLSEVLYYLNDHARARVAGAVELATAGAASAEVVAVTWRHEPHDGYLSGQAAHDELGQALEPAGWARTVSHREGEFVLDVWARGDAAQGVRP